MGEGPPKAMKNGSCSVTTVAGSAALPFVISTGEVMGRWPAQGDGKTLFQQLLPLEAPPSPLSSRPKRSAVERSAVSAVLPLKIDRAYPDFLLRVASDVHVWASP